MSGSRRPASRAIWTACCFRRERDTETPIRTPHHLTALAHARALDRECELIGQVDRWSYFDQRSLSRSFSNQAVERVGPACRLQLAEPKEVAPRRSAVLRPGFIARRRQLEEAPVGRHPSQAVPSTQTGMEPIGLLGQRQESVRVAERQGCKRPQGRKREGRVHARLIAEAALRILRIDQHA